MRKSTLLLAAMLLMVIGTLNTSAMENYDFQDLCMAIGKGGPWAVNDGGDAGFAVNGKTMHYLGDYTEQGFTWNQRFAYEYADGRGKLTFYNKNNKKNQNCGLFSWDYNHYLSVLDLKDGDKVTITVLAGSVTFASETAEGVTIGDDVTSDQTYTISTVEGTTRLDILMSSSCLISKIVIEPNGVETIPVINVSKKTLNLIPGASTKLSYTVVPSNMPIQWKSDNEDVASVDNDGVVTAHATGVANITCYWKSTFSDATASDVCVVSVANVNLSYHPLAKSYDFTIMGNVTLRLGFDSPGMIWNEANSRMVGVFFCDNTGLEQLAVQATAADSNGKGWLIVNGQGLTLGTGAGRCAAIAGIRKGQIVEFIYTGDYFYTHSDDDGIEKTALDEESGCAIYIANEDGMIGFEIDRGCSVKQINVYDPLPEVYTEFVESTGTLTYYYDGKRFYRTGITELYDPVGNPDAVRFTGYYNKVVKAVIDPSMKDAKLTSMNGMFYGGYSMKPIYLKNMTSIEGLENLNTATVTNMNSMFFYCESLTQLDLSSFNTSGVMDMNGMFFDCRKLQMVDLTSFDVSKVTDMRFMFASCKELRTICCTNDWSNTSAQSTNMFFDCKLLVGSEGTTFDSSEVDATYARPDGGTASPGYFTAETMTEISEEFRVKSEELEGAAIYNLAGQKMVNGQSSMVNDKLPRGINIIRYSDGTTRKIMVK